MNNYKLYLDSGEVDLIKAKTYGWSGRWTKLYIYDEDRSVSKLFNLNYIFGIVQEELNKGTDIYIVDLYSKYSKNSKIMVQADKFDLNTYTNELSFLVKIDENDEKMTKIASFNFNYVVGIEKIKEK